MATLTFVPWVRAGAGAAVNAAATAMGANRPAVPVALTVTKTLDGQVPGTLPTVGVSMQLLGPGDVLGLAPGQVIRTEPADGSTGVEPTLFPAVEFADLTLPWLFTPAPENAGWPGGPAPPAGSHRLLPWICLVVVPDQDGIALDKAAKTLTIGRPADARQELPDLGEAWAWAHAQYAGDLDADALGVTPPAGSEVNADPVVAAARLAADPAAGLSRLLCPRRLSADTRYHACVVPTFMAGRVAGLGGTPDPAAPAGPAWDVSPAGEAGLILPVYYSFTFTTGSGGDFQSLAQLLVHPPQVTTAPSTGLGPRTLTVGLPFGQQPPVTSVPLPMPGLMEPVGAAKPRDPSGYPAVQQALQNEITPSSTDTLPELLPTAYGAVQAGLRPADLAADFSGLPAWFTALNTDPRLRVAAALGTRVVAAQREQLVAAAWTQVEQELEANVLLARVQLARAVTTRQAAKHLAGSDGISFLQLISPHASRVQVSAGPVTGSIWSVVRGDPQADPRLPAVTSPTYRRIARPRGPFARNTAPSMPPQVSPQLSPGSLQFDPGQRVQDRVFAERLSPLPASVAAATQAGGQDPINGFAHQVSYPAGLIGPLAQLDPEALLPGASTIPPNTALLLQPNADQVVACMVGANTEVNRLLLWRGVPADPRATPFTYFWDQRGQAGSGPDIQPIAGWQQGATLTDQLAGAAEPILAVRADLLRRYPTTAVYAAKAQPATGSATHTVDLGTIVQPAYTATLPPDLHLFGFPALTVADAIGDPAKSGYFFVLQQQATESRFGSDTMAGAGLPPPASSYWTVASIALVNNSATAVTAGGTTAPAAGTSEPWTVTSPGAFPAPGATGGPFYVADPAQPTEVIAVTGGSGSTWTVTRGAEGTTPVAHSAGFTVKLARQPPDAGAVAGVVRMPPVLVAIYARALLPAGG
jgi:hypothetical protein